MDEAFWKMAFRHEAGHAVAAFRLFDVCNDISANCLAASHGAGFSLEGIDPLDESRDCLDLTIFAAAGEIAAQEYSGDIGRGSAADLQKIGQLLKARPDTRVFHEVTLGFPKTRLFVSKNRTPIDMVASAAFVEFSRLNLVDKQFPKTVIMPKNQLRAILSVFSVLPYDPAL